MTTRIAMIKGDDWPVLRSGIWVFRLRAEGKLDGTTLARSLIERRDGDGVADGFAEAAAGQAECV